MKVLVPLKRVSDPDNANKIKIPAAGDRIDTSHLQWKINPFDEYALEAALRLTENGKQPKTREGEVIVVSMGPPETDAILRGALATGADRAVRVEAQDDALDGRMVAKVLQRIALEEKPDLIVMGKQAVDGESNYVGQALAELLDWPMATFAATIQQEANDKFLVRREVDGGIAVVRVSTPALITVDLRIVAPDSVYSLKTEQGFRYKEGVRFAPLPAIMAAKKKPLQLRTLQELAPDAALSSSYFKFEPPPARKGGIKVKDVDELVRRLAEEAKVL